MGLFGRPDPRDVLVAQLSAQLSDTQAQLLAERRAFNEERQKLIDQLISLANPLALRELKRPVPGESVTPAIPRNYHYPKSEYLVAPPYPSKPPTPPSEPES